MLWAACMPAEWPCPSRLEREAPGLRLNTMPAFFIERPIKIKRMVMCGEMDDGIIKMQIP